MRRTGTLIMGVALAGACVDAPTSTKLLDVSGAQTVGDTLGSYIVVFDPLTPDVPAMAAQVRTRTGGREKYRYSAALKGVAIDNITAASAAAIARMPGVRYVEEDGMMSVSPAQPLPPGGSASPLWNLDRIDTYGNPIYDSFFSYTRTGVGVHVYIVDTGVRGGHAEFTGRIGNGTCVIPWSWGCSPTIDAAGHGTAVASVLAGTTYGVAKSAIIHPVRVDDDGNNIQCSASVAGLDWIRGNAQAPAVANMSINGYPSCFSVRDAIDALVAANVLVTKSAGNNNVDAFSDRSNRSPGAIIVGATVPVDVRAGFSNWGATVTMMAPGQNVRVAWSGSNSDSALVSGTSFAAPLTAGVAATVLEANPTMTAATLRTTLLNAASPVSIGNGMGVANRLLFSLLP